MVSPDIRDAFLVDLHEQFRHAVHEWLTTDVADLWMAAGLMDEMLGAAEADFEF